ncbi:MAG TPA: hypothetical protein PKV72_04905 [Candidatus Peribacteria bacterium]|nr:hypothetical protein [Candidatus Peribacteria bacterium]
MKHTKLATGLLVLATLCQATPAFAYLSPDQVFGGAGLTLAPAPPTAREGADVVAAQQARSAGLRSAAQAQLPSTNDEPADTYVAPKTNTTRNLLDPNVQYDIRQERIANRNATTPTIIITGNGNGTITDSNGNVLHSGAPHVAQTGPEHVLFAVLVLALLGMAWYVRRQSRLASALLR